MIFDTSKQLVVKAWLFTDITSVTSLPGEREGRLGSVRVGWKRRLSVYPPGTPLCSRSWVPNQSAFITPSFSLLLFVENIISRVLIVLSEGIVKNTSILSSPNGSPVQF